MEDHLLQDKSFQQQFGIQPLIPMYLSRQHSISAAIVYSTNVLIYGRKPYKHCLIFSFLSFMCCLFCPATAPPGKTTPFALISVSQWSWSSSQTTNQPPSHRTSKDHQICWNRICPVDFLFLPGLHLHSFDKHILAGACSVFIHFLPSLCQEDDALTYSWATKLTPIFHVVTSSHKFDMVLHGKFINLWVFLLVGNWEFVQLFMAL